MKEFLKNRVGASDAREREKAATDKQADTGAASAHPRVSSARNDHDNGIGS